MIKKFLFLLFLPLIAFADSVTVDLQNVPMKDLVRLVYGEILGVNYVIDGMVQDDLRPVSLKLKNVTPKETAAVVRDVLESQGVVVESLAGVHFVRKADKKGDNQDFRIYRPQYRSVSYLRDLMAPMFPQGAFSVKTAAMPVTAVSGIASTANQAGQIANSSHNNNNNGTQAGAVSTINQGANRTLDADPDVLIVKGSDKDLQRFDKLVKQLDTLSGEVMVKAVIYEVQTTNKVGSAIDLALSVLSGKFGIKLSGGASDSVSSVFAKLSGAGIDVNAMYTALSSDGRFKVVSSPRVRVRSGATAHFSVGDETPILGSVSYDTSGKAIQSVSYKSSGVIFDLKPLVRESAVDLHLSQQISSFVSTTTGVNGSPTLNKRELSTDLTLADNDLIVIGGLESDKDTATNTGLSFLPSFMRSDASEVSKSEIVVMLHLQKI